MYQGDVSISAALIRQGVVPCAPYHPTIGFTPRLLDLYRIASLRCPHLAIQPFIKAICDIQSTPFWPYLSNQFSIALDLFISIRNRIDSRVQAVIGRDEPTWRLRHACPACTYKIEGEPDLIFKMLVTMDGNDSLKRVLRRASSNIDDDDILLEHPSNEREDSRTVGGDYYLTRERVDRWTKEVIAKWLAIPGNTVVSSMETRHSRTCPY